MASSALIPSSAPFSDGEINALNSVVARSSPEQRAWLSGFLAGLGASVPLSSAPAHGAGRTRVPLTILYASESGNAEALAYAAKKSAAKQGFDVRIVDMADADPSSLANSKHLLVFAATWGEGDPPQRAADFYEALMGGSAPRLEGVHFAVLALGDSAYVNFCETGRRIDSRLEQLGAIRVAERVDLDLDFARGAATWTESTLSALQPDQPSPESTVVRVDFRPSLDGVELETATAENPVEAEILSAVNLNGTGSTRETWHVELATDAAGFSYAPGDAIGIVPENDPKLVEELLSITGVDPDASIIRELTHHIDITTLSRPLIEKYARLVGSKELTSLASDVQAFNTFAADRQAIDLFAEYRERLDASTLKGLLRPLPPRLYSVASSPSAHEGEAHLLIGTVRWQSRDRLRNGVTSTFVADRRKTADTLKVYVKPNRHFKLPADPSRPILMIGAGTGVAPFRGFIAEREAQGASGRSWLFFGERNFSHDFLYQLEWQDHISSGALTRIDVAFSRDQPEKVYVQHRLWENREDVRRWIEDGAYIYVCGDEKRMARDVDDTLVRILAETEGGDHQAARTALKAIAKAGRYQRDVY